MKNYFTLSTLLLFSCTKKIESTDLREDQQLKKEGFEWTIAKLTPDFNERVDINKAKVVYENGKPLSILFALKNSTTKEFIFTSNKNRKWIANFITFSNSANGEHFFEVKDLNRKLLGKYFLASNSVSNKTLSNLPTSMGERLISMSSPALPPVTVYGYRRTTGTSIFFISMFWAHGGESDCINNYITEVETFQPEEAGGGGQIEAIEIEADDSATKDSINV